MTGLYCSSPTDSFTALSSNSDMLTGAARSLEQQEKVMKRGRLCLLYDVQQFTLDLMMDTWAASDITLSDNNDIFTQCQLHFLCAAVVTSSLFLVLQGADFLVYRSNHRLVSCWWAKPSFQTHTYTFICAMQKTFHCVTWSWQKPAVKQS